MEPIEVNQSRNLNQTSEDDVIEADVIEEDGIDEEPVNVIGNAPRRKVQRGVNEPDWLDRNMTKVLAALGIGLAIAVVVAAIKSGNNGSSAAKPGNLSSSLPGAGTKVLFPA